MSEKSPVDYRSLLKEAIVSMEKLKSRISALEAEKAEPIAVVGMACRFPGKASNVRGFWELLEGGESAITEVPADRWDVDAYDDPDPDAPGKIYSRWGGFLERVDGFEPQFFGITPREAVTMDPQQRLLLEVAWEALEDAAIAPARLAGTPTGVFIGISFSEYGAMMNTSVSEADRDLYSGTGTALSIAAGRVAYALGLNGPTMAVDTACSSSLVSVHLAIQSLRQKECQVALAGGVSLILSPDGSLVTCRGHMLSFDGRCKTFDDAADGYVRGEGSGFVVLKRLKDAVKDGDRVLAVLLGSAVNQDGRSSGLTAPNGAAQEALLRSALRNASIDGDRISYLEAHGTGTSLGDPIEMRAIDAVLSTGRPADAPLRVGSVKTNLGHLESAAGIAGLMKVIAALQHRRIPAHLNFTVPSARIPWSAMPIRIPTVAMDWPQGSGPRTAGVSAFGFSGTNAHVIVQEAPAEPVAAAGSRTQHLLTLSARTDGALRQLAARYAAHLVSVSDDQLADVCVTANTGRARLDRRVAIVSGSVADAAQKLGAVAAGREAAGVVTRDVRDGDKPRIAFLFTGQGSQYPGMGRELFELHPVFRESIEECDALLGEIDGRRLLSVIHPDDSTGADAVLQQTGFAQPALFALEYSVARLLKSLGVEPAAVVGHSVGEIAAACVAGVFSLSDGLKLIAARGRLMQALPAGGGMLAVSAHVGVVRDALGPAAGSVAIAALNGPADVVLAGHRTALETVQQVFADAGLKTSWLNVSHAFHSPLMQPMVEAFAATLQTLTYRRPSLRIVSNLTAQPVTEAEPMNADYWQRHVLAPVRFSESLDSVRAAGYDLFVEVGPHPVLSPLGSKADADRAATWLPVLRRGKSDWQQLLLALGELFVRGVDFDADALEWPRRGRRVSLPTYPFERERYWFEASRRERTMPEGLHPLLGQRLQSPSVSDAVFSTTLSASQPTFLADHVVFDSTVFPATGYLEMALAGGRLAFGYDASIEEFQIEEPLLLDGDAERDVQLIIAPAQARRAAFKVYSRSRDAAEQAWTRHATGVLTAAVAAPALDADEIANARGACSVVIDVAELYRRLSACGISYGPSFQAIRELWRGPGQAVGRLAVPNVLDRDAGYHVHPAYLDAALQTLAAAFADERATEDTLFLPVGVEAVRVYSQPPASVWSYARIREHAPNAQAMQVDVTWFDDDGRTVLDLAGVTVQRASAAALKRAGARPLIDATYEVRWESQPLTGATSGPGRWLILGDNREVPAGLGEALRQRGSVHVCGLAASVYQAAERDHFRLDLENSDHLAWLLGDVGAPLDGIVVIATAAPCASLDEQERFVGQSYRRVHALIRALTLSSASPRLYLVTRGSQAAGSVPHAPDVAQATIQGLCRVIAIEQPQLRCTSIDLDPFGDPEEPARLAAEIVAQSREDQVTFRGGARQVARLARPRQATDDRRLPVPAGESFQLTTSRRGVLDSLVIEPRDRKSLAPGDVEIEVAAAGLNFRDVLNALGMYPGDPGPMGGECAGRVVNVGSDVTAFRPGDDVFCMTGASFSRFVTAPASFVAHKPAALSFEQAATMPVAFLTAHHGLHALAQIKRGDRVLVHAAAGGVGMAALQLALRAGAEVFATAGSAEKRAFVRALGARAVFSSRQADFVEPLRSLTDGRGVDTVLNALTGEFIPASLSVLAPGGRFLEIGKAEIWDAARVQAVNPAITYHPFDLTEVMATAPELITAMFGDLLAGLADGSLRPLPYRTFGLDEAVGAYRFMAQARHVGKVVLIVPSPDSGDRPPAIQRDASYLITGGCGGLGLELARWLVERQAGRVVLTGRSAPTAGAARAIDELRATGARVDVVRADITSEPDVRRLLAECESGGEPLRGIIHAAGVLDDGMFVDQSWERTSRVLGPKMRGGWLLHDLTQHRALDFFVLFSSVSSVFGSPGQSSYAAANAYLDALAHHRRALGQAALAINWGGWSDIGMAARLGARDQARLSEKGIDLITPSQGVHAFEQLLKGHATQAIVVPIRWPRLLQPFPRGSEPSLLQAIASDVKTRTDEPAGVRHGDAWRAVGLAEGSDRTRLIEAFVVAEVTRVVGLGSASDVDPDADLSSLGVDSLMLVELKNRLEAVTGLGVTIPDLLESGSSRRLAHVLVRLLGSNAGTAPALVPAGVGATEEGEL